MKKIMLILTSVLLLGGLSGCKKDPVEKVEPLKITRYDNSFEARGGTGTITVENYGTDLKAEPNSDWCTIKSIEGNTITFEIAPTLQIASQTTQIKVSSNGFSEDLAITQLGMVFTMDKDIPLTVSFLGKEEKVMYTRNNSTLEARPAEVPEWITWKHEQDGLVLTFEPNTSAPRSADLVISLYNGDVKHTDALSTISITQLGILDLNNIPGEWELTYTSFPILKDVVYATHNGMPMKDIFDSGVEVKETITLEADNSDPDSPKLRATLSGYPIVMEINKSNTHISIPGWQKDLGTYNSHDTEYKVVRGQVLYDKDAEKINIGALVNEYSFKDNQWMVARPTSEETEDGIKLTYTFKGDEAFPATGMCLFGEVAMGLPLNILYGRFIEIYHEVSISRVFTE